MELGTFRGVLKGTDVSCWRSIVPAIRQATVTFKGGMAFEALAGSGQALTMDARLEEGGDNQGFSPMELLLIGLGGCTGMDVIAILRKMRQEIDDYRVEVEGTRRDEHPKIFTQIRVTHVVRGRELDPKLVARAVELSATKYCPVSAMLGQAAEVQHEFRIEAVD
jgi:putative redox protein